MATHRSFAVFATSLALASSGSLVALGQEGPATRGSVKVQSRYFNPFAVGTTRLTLNRFGVFQVAGAGLNTSASVAAAISSSLVVSDGSSTGNSSALAVNSVRPPYRPEERSPFRPPPRPPFSPP